MKATTHHSMANHQIKSHGISWFSLPVVLLDGDNEYLEYPAKGIIRICEQHTDLSAPSTVFHQLDRDGSLGPPVTVRHPVFRYEGEIC